MTPSDTAPEKGADDSRPEGFDAIDVADYVAAFDSQSRVRGSPPTGVQRVVTVRDGRALTIGLRGLAVHQPGFNVGEELYWGYHVDRECIVFATSRAALVRAARSDEGVSRPFSGDPAARDRFVEGTSRLREGNPGEVITTIPAVFASDHDPFSGLGVDVDPGLVEDDSPDVPAPKAGTVYVVVAEHYEGEMGRETAFSLETVADVAERLDREAIETRPYLLTTNREQARMLAGILVDSGVETHYSQLVGSAPAPPETLRALTGERDADPSYVAAALEHLERIGGIALAAGSD